MSRIPQAKETFKYFLLAGLNYRGSASPYEKFTASQASGHRVQKVIREVMEEGRLKMEA
jgi:hypothetical protein